MKKILFVTESLGRGGMERVQVTLANALVARSYDVTLLCYSSTNDLLYDLDSRVKYLYKPQRRFPILEKLPYVHRFFKSKKFTWEHRVSAKRLYKYYVGREKFNVEVAFYRGPSIKIISGSSNKNSIKLAWVHTDFKLCNPKSIIGWFNDNNEVKVAYDKFDHICCVSDMAKKSFSEVIGCADKLETVYNMIDFDLVKKRAEEKCPIKKEKFTIIFVGRLINDKRVDRILSADKKLVNEGFDFDVWIVGGYLEGTFEKSLQDYAQENNLTNVKFFGMQKNPYKFMKEADLFVLSSQREGFALVLPEAMACGLPVMSTACTGPSEILDGDKYGILVENNDDGIYNELKKVLLDNTILEKYRTMSRKRFEDFSDDKIVKDIIKLFENV